MSITPTQKRISDLIECFENSRPDRYAGLVYIKGDTGHLSGGELMASLTSGSLGKICRRYAAKGGTKIPEALVQKAEAKDTSLDTDKAFRDAWKAAAADPLMHDAQDEFFYDLYQSPASAWCRAHGYTQPLTVALVMDGHIQGAFDKILTIMGGATPGAENEQRWATIYINTRFDWLKFHPNPVLRQTTYRMATFKELVRVGNWSLEAPIKVLFKDGSSFML